jgi:hypothetical protein
MLRVHIETEKRSDLTLMRPPPPNKLEIVLSKLQSPGPRVANIDVLYNAEAVRQMRPEGGRRKCEHSPGRADVAEEHWRGGGAWLSTVERVTQETVGEDFLEDVVRKSSDWAPRGRHRGRWHRCGADGRSLAVEDQPRHSIRSMRTVYLHIVCYSICGITYMEMIITCLLHFAAWK